MKKLLTILTLAIPVLVFSQKSDNENEKRKKGVLSMGYWN